MFIKTCPFRTAAVASAVAVASASLVWAEGTLPKSVVRGELGANLDEFFSRLSPFGFSAAVVIATDGEIVLEKGYGFADREKNQPITVDTVFTIGSITKQFTGAAILTLEMQGELSVSDPISKYFDNVPPDKAGITIHHLLTHTAALPGALGDDFDVRATRDWIVEQAMDTPLLWEPGTRYRYSNVGYSLLGAIIEITSGDSYESYVNKHLFEPAGMKRTGYKLADWDGLPIAQGYRNGRRWGTILERPWLADGPGWNLRANGGIHSTVGDMYRWHLALEDESVLSNLAKHKLYGRHADEGGGDSYYGYGWAITESERGTTLITHDGGNGIFFANFLRFVDEDVVIFLASNTPDSKAQWMSPSIARIIFGGDVAMPPKVDIAAVDQSMLERYAGRYESDSGARFEVRADHRHLWIASAAQPAVDALIYPGDIKSALRAELNERTGEIAAGFVRQDFTAFEKVCPDEARFKRIVGYVERTWPQLQERLGTFKDVEVLGTGPVWWDDGAWLATWGRLNFQRGAQVFRIHWNQNKTFAGLGGQAIPYPADLSCVPVSQTTFVGYQLGLSDKPAGIEFRSTADGGMELVVSTRAKPLVARKLKS